VTDPLATLLAAEPAGGPGGAPRHGPGGHHRVPRARRWPLVLGIVSGAVLVALVLVIAPWDPYRIQWYEDQYTVLTGEPAPADVLAIADATGMSDEGRLIYLASTPEIEQAAAFNEDCKVESQVTLGCFDGTDIFVYSVTDARLAGTMEVTAAHEMLHAAYQRLTDDDRDEVDALVAAFIETLPADDPTFATLEGGYAAEQYADEWHSRIGTEYADLPPALEQHYARYFDDRGKVLALQASSVALLQAFEARLTELAAQLDELGTALEARQSGYEALVAQLDADIQSFNARADSGDFDSQAQFDAERAALIARQDAAEAERLALNAQIDEYNTRVDELTALDADYADLYQQLDSTNPPPDVVS
jgi:hypothetical protein